MGVTAEGFYDAAEVEVVAGDGYVTLYIGQCPGVVLSPRQAEDMHCRLKVAAMESRFLTRIAQVKEVDNAGFDAEAGRENHDRR